MDEMDHPDDIQRQWFQAAQDQVRSNMEQRKQQLGFLTETEADHQKQETGLAFRV
jgi:hypothetical protein